jgi:Tol biopolymer transport system component
VKDTSDGSIERASGGLAGASANNESFYCDISADGRFVAFDSMATNLVTGDTNDQTDSFVYDRQNPSATSRVSVGLEGTEADGTSVRPSISADGRYVAFQSWASNLVAGDANGAADIYVYDRTTGKTTRASVGIGAESNGSSERPSISANGRYVAFNSEASNLVDGDSNGAMDVFVRDLVEGKTTIVSVSTTHEAGNEQSGYVTSISSDGLKVAYDSRASNLVLSDTNNEYDVFVGTLDPPTTELAGSGTSVGRPWTRWIVRRNSRALVYGYLSSRHAAGSYPVSLSCYRLEDGAWVLRKTVSLKIARGRVRNRSKYAGYVRLPLRGRWKVVATHAHAGYQPDISGARYFWVR